jgi:hypothetical protein
LRDEVEPLRLDADFVPRCVRAEVFALADLRPVLLRAVLLRDELDFRDVPRELDDFRLLVAMF